MIKLGIIGTNWITQQFVDGVKDNSSYQLTSVYSRHIETAKTFAQKNGASEVFDDLKKFFNEGVFDTVYVASPNSAHFEQVKMAIGSNKDVIVEKTAFANKSEMNQIISLLHQHPSVHYFEGARNIHTPNFHAIEEQVGKMEHIAGANFTYSKYSSRYNAVLSGEEPNVFSLNFGGGALQDLGVYTVYDSLALFGVPETYSYFPQIIRTGVDGKGTAILRYKDFDVTLNFSKITNSFSTSEIYGLKDVIEIDDAGEITNVKYVDANKERTDISAKPLDNPMAPEIADFAKILEDPDTKENKDLYEYWLNLSIQANDILYKLRKSANLVFSFEK